MRYLRQQVLNRRAPYDQRLYVDMTDSIVMKTTNNLVLPSGTDAQRPVSPVVGMIRYNTTSNEVEVFEGTVDQRWRNIRYKESTQIRQSILGYGDASTVHFRLPNNVAFPTMANGDTWSGSNILVFVEQVPQFFTTNYTVENGPSIPGQVYLPKTSGVTAIGSTTIYFNPAVANPNVVYPAVDITGAVVTGDPAITLGSVVVSYTTNSQGQLTSIVMNNPTAGTTIANNTVITITDSTNTPVGFYLQFTSAVPLGKPVTILYGFDK